MLDQTFHQPLVPDTCTSLTPNKESCTFRTISTSSQSTTPQNQQEMAGKEDASTRLAALRNQAQSHLSEISAINQAEIDADNKRRSDWYAEWNHRASLTKPKSKPQKRTTRHLPAKREAKSRRAARSSPSDHSDEQDAGEVSDSATGKQKLRSAQDVLHRLLHDPTYSSKLHLYRIGYLDRLEGIKEVSVAEWQERTQDIDGEEWVPFHRIRWFKRVADESNGETAEGGQDGKGGEIVWHRFDKYDVIFGSGKQ